MADDYMNHDEYEEPNIVSTMEETDRKCPMCGGVMDFNPATQKLLCPYCDHAEDIASKEKFVAEELDFASAEETASTDWGVATKIVLCNSCGAENIYDVNAVSNVCPYCGSNHVMETTGEDSMAPGALVTFRLDSKMAADRFREWIGGKFFCPKLAKESAKPDSFQGLYLPFWTFDSQTYNSYSGEYGHRRTYTDNDGNTRTKTDWYSTRGRFDHFIDDMLVCASTRQNGGLITKLEPYNTSDVVEYKPEYMAGYMAEKYTVKLQPAWEVAQSRIARLLKEEARSIIIASHHADAARNVVVNTEHNNITYKYIMLPVWISSFKYEGKVYTFMVNGQTGKVSGSTPISWIKVALVVLAIIIVIALWYYIGI